MHSTVHSNQKKYRTSPDLSSVWLLCYVLVKCVGVAGSCTVRALTVWLVDDNEADLEIVADDDHITLAGPLVRIV